MPVCIKCGLEHYRFVRCDDVDDWNSRHQELEVARQPPVRVEHGEPPPGFREIRGAPVSGGLPPPPGFRYF